MKLGVALSIAAMSIGCAAGHTAERAQNAATAAGYEVDLELCLKNSKTLAAYTACADAADHKWGRKP